ncbi:HD domain-containing protein 2 [Mayamaea pseudoterrestris]|nr:HD domain-containing protein 2 [Mayamaea pseudoterrestris]
MLPSNFCFWSLFICTLVHQSTSYLSLPSAKRMPIKMSSAATPDATSFPASPTNLDETSKVSAAIAFAKLVGKLKTTPRTGWVRRGVPRYESVADHSWRVAALSLVMASSSNGTASIDLAKCMQLAVVHDMAECIVGDIPPDDNVSKEDKQRMELDAAQTIAQLLHGVNGNGSEQASKGDAGSYFLNLFHEFELRDTPESKVVKDLDLMDMIIQADEYEERFGTDLSDFFVNTQPSRFQNPFMRQMAEQVHVQRTERIARQSKAVNGSASSDLSAKDKAFVEEFSRASSSLDTVEIERVVKALRAWDER